MPKKHGSRTQALRRIARIRKRIHAIDYVCSGTLMHRTKCCGKPSCRCARDVAERHGPYHEWSRRQEGRLLHSVLPAHQAALVEHAIANYRKILRLLCAWEAETARVIQTKNKRN